MSRSFLNFRMVFIVRIHRREGFQTQWFPTLLYANKDDPLKIALSLVTVHLFDIRGKL
ncbi:hypothetical protein T11_13978 [Trichinella zimbabwensis]|uniref:Uncharacterized protein n=1 Tax=Trichinella zimbabwensis TaxID=268475 RepID=A0A0V1GL59_9BILA|nr:hypothetical protein T11_13978 [Trichinella zimbabwensis]